MNAEPDDTNYESGDSVDDRKDDRSRSKKCKKKLPKKAKGSEPQQPKVTLRGLLNVLCGPGANDGPLVFCTTNFPISLDEALVGPGRIDRRIFLGPRSKLVAAITFPRIFRH
ncbi:hypothetical protein PMIN06_000987 [Paraphaeosphaeria minitans]